MIAVNRERVTTGACRYGFTLSYIHTHLIEIIEIIDFENWERHTSVLISTCSTGESLTINHGKLATNSHFPIHFSLTDVALEIVASSKM